ncbi:olfactory receptor 2G3-like [Erythrolamprus reginae]|uniref:olfactory receptor 2G3-like n=1 Tax=Erythrolamprus reginae TaxID=121349 RepID=UPI00396CBA72
MNKETSWENSNQSYPGYFILLGMADRPRLEMLLFALVLTCYLMALLGNSTIIVVSRLDPSLHTPMYFFLSNLSLVDICFTTSLGPHILVNLWRKSKTISYSACVAQLYLSLSVGCTECVLLVVMAYDRYAAICHPLHYTTTMSYSRCITMAAASWISGFSHSLIHSVMVIRLPLCGPNQIDHFFCELPAILKLVCVDTSINEVLVLVGSALFLLVPVSLIMVSYGCIAAAVMKIRSSEGRKRAFNTCSSHLMVVWIFYGTSIFSYLLPRSSSFHDEVKLTSLFYAFVTTTLNPLIYTLRNKEVHKALQRLMKK